MNCFVVVSHHPMFEITITHATDWSQKDESDSTPPERKRSVDLCNLNVALIEALHMTIINTALLLFCSTLYFPDIKFRKRDSYLAIKASLFRQR